VNFKFQVNYIILLKDYILKKKTAFITEAKGFMNLIKDTQENKNKVLKKTQSLLIIDRFCHRRIINVLALLQYKTFRNV